MGGWGADLGGAARSQHHSFLGGLMSQERTQPQRKHGGKRSSVAGGSCSSHGKGAKLPAPYGRPWHLPSLPSWKGATASSTDSRGGCLRGCRDKLGSGGRQAGFSAQLCSLLFQGPWESLSVTPFTFRSVNGLTMTNVRGSERRCG